MAYDDDLNAWVATDYGLVVEWMRDARRFTVDDPRFSTGQVLGPSMLSLDGEEHRRHRTPFAGAFGAATLRGPLTERVRELAVERVTNLRDSRRQTLDVRTELAGPFSADVMRAALGLDHITSEDLLGWYRDIVSAVANISNGASMGTSHHASVSALSEAISTSLAFDGAMLAGPASELSSAELVSNTAVCLFGGIETAEGMIANLFAHLLNHPEALAIAIDDQRLMRAVDESLRLEPSVTRLDRFATEDVTVGQAHVKRGDMVVLSIAGANRDPKVFNNPHTYVPERPNANKHVTFAQGPHACIAMHLSRLEAATAFETALRLLPGLHLVEPAIGAPSGTVFRKWEALTAGWGGG